MKKILVLAILALAVIVTAVACTSNDQPTDTTAETVIDTEASTEAEATTTQETLTETTVEETTLAETEVADTTAPETEATTIPAETEAQTEAPTFPYVSKHELGSDFIKGRMDVFYQNGENYFAEFPNADMADDKLEQLAGNIVTFEFGMPVESIGAYGWIGFTQPIESYGYFIDDEFTYDPNFTYIGQDDAAVKGSGAGGKHAVRYNITADLSKLTPGIYDFGFVAKLADGTVVLIHQLTIDIKD